MIIEETFKSYYKYIMKKITNFDLQGQYFTD